MTGPLGSVLDPKAQAEKLVEKALTPSISEFTLDGFKVERVEADPGDFDCISALLPAVATSYDLSPQKKVYLKVVSLSASGMHQAPSVAVTHP